MRRYYLSAICLSILTAMFVTSCHKQHSTAQNNSLSEINVAVPQQRTVTLYKTYPGTIYANSATDIVARVNGYLLSQNYNNGDMVKAGQILFTIEPTQYADAVTSAQAQLETAQAQLEYSSQRYEAISQAAKADAASLMEVAEAKSNWQTAEQQVKNAKASLETAKTNLGYCTVRAPFAGHASAATVSQHTYLSGEASPQVLTTIYDDTYVRADFFIDDATFINLMNSRNLELPFDSIPISFTDNLPHSYTGKIIYFAPDINKGTGTMELRALIHNPYEELHEGMYANVSLPYDIAENAILVKDAAIGFDQRGRYLYTVGDSGIVSYTPVEVGGTVDDTLRIITSGITPDTRYVTQALLKVRDGMRVKPVLTR